MSKFVGKRSLFVSDKIARKGNETMEDLVRQSFGKYFRVVEGDRFSYGGRILSVESPEMQFVLLSEEPDGTKRYNLKVSFPDLSALVSSEGGWNAFFNPGMGDEFRVIPYKGKESVMEAGLNGLQIILDEELTDFVFSSDKPFDQDELDEMDNINSPLRS